MHLHQAGGDELVDVGHDLRVLQVVLRVLGIGLEVLQHLPSTSSSGPLPLSATDPHSACLSWSSEKYIT